MKFEEYIKKDTFEQFLREVFNREYIVTSDPDKDQNEFDEWMRGLDVEDWLSYAEAWKNTQVEIDIINRNKDEF